MKNGIKKHHKRQEIKDTIVRWIHEQGLQPGDRILGQNELAVMLGTTAVTVHKALTELAAERVVHRRNGSGTFIGPSPDRNATRAICFVLPGEHLDSPEYNPIYWPYIQLVYRAFLDSVGTTWTFSTRVVRPGTPPGTVARDFAAYDGVFFHHAKEPSDLLRYLVRNQIAPVIAFGKPRPGLSCLTIDHDAVAGTAKAMTHLLLLGYRRIALVASRYDWGRFWLEGYRQALREHSLPYDPDLVVRAGEPGQEGIRAASLLAGRGLKCDAVLAATDIHALGVIEGFRKAGIGVPEDVGVMGYDGLDHAVHQPPFLTSLETPYRKMIEAGLAELERCAGKPTPRRHLEFVGEVLAGRTTAARRDAAPADLAMAAGK